MQIAYSSLLREFPAGEIVSKIISAYSPYLGCLTPIWVVVFLDTTLGLWGICNIPHPHSPPPPPKKNKSPANARGIRGLHNSRYATCINQLYYFRTLRIQFENWNLCFLQKNAGVLAILLNQGACTTWAHVSTMWWPRLKIKDPN